MEHGQQAEESIGAMLSSIAAVLREVSDKLDAVAARVDGAVVLPPAEHGLEARLAKLEAWAFRAGQDISGIDGRLEKVEAGAAARPPLPRATRRNAASSDATEPDAVAPTAREGGARRYDPGSEHSTSRESAAPESNAVPQRGFTPPREPAPQEQSATSGFTAPTPRAPTTAPREPIQSTREPIQATPESIPSSREPVRANHESIQSAREPAQAAHEPNQPAHEPVQASHEQTDTPREQSTQSREPTTLREPVAVPREPTPAAQTFTAPTPREPLPVRQSSFTAPRESVGSPYQNFTSPQEKPYESAVPSAHDSGDHGAGRTNGAAPQDNGVALTGAQHRASDESLLPVDNTHVDKLQAMLDELKRTAAAPLGRNDIFGPPATDLGANSYQPERSTDTPRDYRLSSPPSS